MSIRTIMTAAAAAALLASGAAAQQGQGPSAGQTTPDQGRSSGGAAGETRSSQRGGSPYPNQSGSSPTILDPGEDAASERGGEEPRERQRAPGSRRGQNDFEEEPDEESDAADALVPPTP